MYTESNVYYYSTEIYYIKNNSQNWKHNFIVRQLYSVKKIKKTSSFIQNESYQNNFIYIKKL